MKFMVFCRLFNLTHFKCEETNKCNGVYILVVHWDDFYESILNVASYLHDVFSIVYFI